MNSASVVFLFVFLFWSASAIPCGSWNFDKSHDIILTHPAQDEIILVMFSEDADAEADAGESEKNPVQSDNIPTDDDGSDDKLSGEVVDSAGNKGLSAIANSDPLPSNKTQELPHQQTYNTTEAIIEDVGFTTESGTEV